MEYISVPATPLEYPQSIRAVFFDAGYTLLAPHPSIADIVINACEARGVALNRAAIEVALPHAEATLRRLAKANPHTWGDEAEIERMWVAYFTELLRPVLPNASAEEIQTAAHAVEDAFNEATSYALYPDVVPTLDALKTRELTLGVISDWGVGLGLVLRHHDLIQYFDFAVISAAVRHAKPDPELFQTALRRADAIPDYALHIGDSYVLDVLGARAAGITPVLIDRAGHYDPAQLDCHVVRDLYGLLALLEVNAP